MVVLHVVGKFAVSDCDSAITGAQEHARSGWQSFDCSIRCVGKPAVVCSLCKLVSVGNLNCWYGERLLPILHPGCPAWNVLPHKQTQHASQVGA